MDKEITKKLYDNEKYLYYIRYNPRWYVILNKDPEAFKDFEKEVKYNLKLTTSDKINNFRKQIDFINGMIRYLNSG